MRNDEAHRAAVLCRQRLALPGGRENRVLGGLVMSHGDPEKMMAIQGVGQVLSQLARTLTIPFSLGVTVLLYYDRRVRTEALDVQMMAESLPATPAAAPAAPGWG